MIAVLSAIAVAGGLLVGRLVAARHHARALPAREAEREQGAATDGEGGEAPVDHDESGAAHADVDWSGFPCALGDVVLRNRDGAEAWLGGALVLREDAPAAVLFISPDRAGDLAIYARPRPSAEIAWLVPVKRESLHVGAEPPSVIEIEGVRFERKRRLPLHADRVGTGAPDVGGTVILGEYEAAAGEVAIVIVAEGGGLAWRGARLREGEFEVWSGEKAREEL